MDEPVTHTNDHGSFLVRGLRDGELNRWAEHCAACFAYKANPPPADFFLSRYTVDPHHEAGTRSIRVVIAAAEADAEEPEFLSSARLLFRTIWVEGRQFRVGGIADVCTKPACQRQGLAHLALDSCLLLAKHCGLPVTALHAGMNVLPLYRSMGWQSIPVRLVKVPVVSLPVYEDTAFDIARADGLNAELCATLAELYDATASQLDGMLKRDADYWSTWILPELSSAGRELWTCTDGESTIVAYMAIRRFPSGDVVMSEFCCRSAVHTELILPRLFSAVADSASDHLLVKCPLVLIEPWLGDLGLDLTTLERVDDEGWMYRVSEECTQPLPTVDRHLVCLLDTF